MVAGRVAVTPRALTSVARGVAASRLGVAASAVSVHLSDAAGLLAVTVAAPVRLTADPGEGLIARSGAARAEIARDITEITGSTVGSVRLRVTNVQRDETRRVS